MYASTAFIFVVSHVVSITLGVLRWYTEKNTQSPSYGADLLLSHCRKSESERSQSLDSSIHLNVNAKLSPLNSCLPHTEALRTLWTTAFIALLLLSKIWRHHWRNFRVVYGFPRCFLLVAEMCSARYDWGLFLKYICCKSVARRGCNKKARSKVVKSGTNIHYLKLLISTTLPMGEEELSPLQKTGLFRKHLKGQKYSIKK